MEDFIFIVFLIIFFVGPLIKKILEGLSGAAPPAKRPSRQDVKEYLEKMRTAAGEQEKGYRAPATKPKYPQPAAQPGKSRQAAGLPTPGDGAAGKLTTAPQVETQFAAAVGREAQPSAKGSPKIKTALPANGLEKKILGNSALTEVQKAIVLKEILDRPKALRTQS